METITNGQPFNARRYVLELASNNYVFRMKLYMNKFKTMKEKAELVNSKVDNTTPLLAACRHGHLEMVIYLLNECNADFELTGSVLFDGETIEGATPLWCAAAVGQSAIVRVLVIKGACVNSTTHTQSTPLRAACFDGHYNIVQFLVERGADIEIANKHGHTCLMIACYKGHYKIAKYLLSLNANVNKKSIKGNTALHDCAESGNLDILKILLDHGGKMDVDSYGMTPLLAASVTGHTSIVDYIINVYRKVDRKEIIDALELLGATYVDRKRDMHAAIDVWKKAMTLRYDQDYPVINKNIPPVKIEAYNFIQEVKYPSELDDLATDPDKMRVQALLIRERILGPAHPDTSYYIRYRGAIYADAGRFSRCIALWNYALDMQQSILEPLNPMTGSSFFSFTELFTLMMGDDVQINRNRKIPLLEYKDIMTVLTKAINEIRSCFGPNNKPNYDETCMQRMIIITLHLCSLLAKLLTFRTPEESHEGHRLVYKLVSLNIKLHNNTNILHLICRNKNTLMSRYPTCQFPSTNLIKMLCKTGINVNERDGDGNTALHLIALSPLHKSHIAQALLNNGAHLDIANNNGKTYRDLINVKLSTVVNELKYTTLACLAARIIRNNSIPYEGKVPVTLYSFISNH